MKKDLTELVFILDRSGSMSGLEADTIGGFNSMIEKQKKETGEAVVSLVLFDNDTEVIYDRIPLDKIKRLNKKQYYVRGCTALLDAVGSSIRHIKKLRDKMAEEELPEKTVFIITTDGMENASREYTYSKVKKMIENRKKKNNWEFIFLGANIDAVEVADRFGVSANRAMNYVCDKKGIKLHYDAVAGAVSAIRNSKAGKEREVLFEAACAPVNEDFKKRG